MKNHNKIKRLLSIMTQLRHPQKGCSWDKKQTLESIIPYTIEEVYEVAEEIHNKNFNNLKNELGDLLFQVVYLSQIAKEKKKFNFYDVVDTISKKMEERHPHVFLNKKFKSDKELNEWWEKSKKIKKMDSILDNIPNNLPSITKAYKIQKKVAKFGFDYKNIINAIDKVEEELIELKKEIIRNKKSKIKEELGDLIFAILDLSRKINLNPENILAKANKKFIKRFKHMEKKILVNNKNMVKMTDKKINKYWNESKKNN